MDSRTRSALLITVVAVLAVGLSAATLTSAVESNAEGSGGGGGGGVQSDAGPVDLDIENPSGGDSLSILERVLAVLLVLGALGALVYALLYRKRAVALLGIIVAAAVVIWLFTQAISMLSAPSGSGGLFGGLSGLTGEGGGEESELQSFRVLTVILVGAGLAVLAVYLLTGSERSPLTPDEDEGDATEERGDATEMGRIAGRVADRIERQDADESLENQVYEAYSEMTAQLDVPNDESTTPREFAEAAASRGMADDDVSALTSLFEAVRYGGYSATADREQEAIETLRRIERRYTDE
ncbi:DUF4129 domain-containing protein [Halovenus sp. WSH3]|uniref:DUF4129 domain-containing protein n=1 Tax=Halovenus carboxidivorans TaxID=2692199 RepID=A0A6B0T744_9EURY|nr:DUF4129 domain-containing protein [Halovenus carboxidivorans]MXR51112.1 DUF4129 domain-containing protein [Halovenus carboxidivorans]